MTKVELKGFSFEIDLLHLKYQDNSLWVICDTLVHKGERIELLLPVTPVSKNGF